MTETLKTEKKYEEKVSLLRNKDSGWTAAIKKQLQMFGKRRLHLGVREGRKDNETGD